MCDVRDDECEDDSKCQNGWDCPLPDVSVVPLFSLAGGGQRFSLSLWEEGVIRCFNWHAAGLYTEHDDGRGEGEVEVEVGDRQS